MEHLLSQVIDSSEHMCFLLGPFGRLLLGNSRFKDFIASKFDLKVEIGMEISILLPFLDSSAWMSILKGSKSQIIIDYQSSTFTLRCSHLYRESGDIESVIIWLTVQDVPIPKTEESFLSINNQPNKTEPPETSRNNVSTLLNDSGIELWSANCQFEIIWSTKQENVNMNIQTMLENTHTDDQKDVVHLLHEAVRKKSTFDANVRMLKIRDYCWFHLKAIPELNTRGEILYWIGMTRDIDYDESKSKVNELNTLLFNNGKVEWDLLSNRVNLEESSKNLIGLKTNEIEFQDFIRLIQDSDQNTLLTAFNDCKEGKGRFSVGVRVKSSSKWINMTGELSSDVDGKPIKITAIVIDITPSKKRRFDGVDDKVKLHIDQQRLQEFADTICHELRNPLNGIYGGVHLMKETLSTLPEAPWLTTIQDCISIISKCSKQQKIILDDILNLSKLHFNQMDLVIKEFRLVKLLKSMVRIYDLQIKTKQLKLDLDLPSNEIWIKGDEHCISLIFSNIISNAIKFTEKGKIDVKLRVKSDENSERIHLVVRDTGNGLSQAQIQHIKNEFENPLQLKRKTLGLVICHKICQLMDGKIEISSEENVGTTIQVSLKIELVKEKKKEKEKDVIKMDLGEKTILIVEDNVINQKILKNFLNRNGLYCHIANNGIEALEQFQNFHFDLIFMDIEMPFMNGLEATKNIREKSSIPIVGLSGNARKEQIETAISIGMTAYITKPYQKQHILQCVELYTKA